MLPRIMQKIICFGDSNVEYGTSVDEQGFICRLAERYSRRADVLARGFSGYTTREALSVLREAVLDEHPHITIVLFGTYDCVLPDQITHVPIKEYCQNLEMLAQKIAIEGSWIVIVTPPPVYERMTRSRTLKHTDAYAAACFKLALDMQLPVVDLFHHLQEVDDWETDCLRDGIHLNARGMNILYRELCEELDRIHPLKEFPRMGLENI